MGRLITKHSSTPGVVPEPEALLTGELAVNTADARLFTKHTDGSIKELGAPSLSGEVTRANFIEYMLETDPLTFFEESRYYRGVGFASHVLNQVGLGFFGTSAVTGAGASATPGANRVLLLSAGSTATGTARYQSLGLASTFDRIGRRYYSSSLAVEYRCYFSLQAHVLNLSSAAERYKHIISLGGWLINDAVGTFGIRISHTDNENSGNWVIQYVAADLTTIVTVNTAVAPSTNPTADAAYIKAELHRNGSGASEIKITFGKSSPVVYTITNSSFHTSGTFITPTFSANITKSVGTTTRIVGCTDPIFGGWFPGAG